LAKDSVPVGGVSDFESGAVWTQTDLANKDWVVVADGGSEVVTTIIFGGWFRRRPVFVPVGGAGVGLPFLSSPIQRGERGDLRSIASVGIAHLLAVASWRKKAVAVND